MAYTEPDCWRPFKASSELNKVDGDRRMSSYHQLGFDLLVKNEYFEY